MSRNLLSGENRLCRNWSQKQLRELRPRSRSGFCSFTLQNSSSSSLCVQSLFVIHGGVGGRQEKLSLCVSVSVSVSVGQDANG